VPRRAQGFEHTDESLEALLDEANSWVRRGGGGDVGGSANSAEESHRRQTGYLPGSKKLPDDDDYDDDDDNDDGDGEGEGHSEDAVSADARSFERDVAEPDAHFEEDSLDDDVLVPPAKRYAGASVYFKSGDDDDDYDDDDPELAVCFGAFSSHSLYVATSPTPFCGGEGVRCAGIISCS